jgi:hypothetical protein
VSGDFVSPGFVVAWIDENSARVLMQGFRGDGVKLGGEIVVNSRPVRADHRPVIA